MVITIGPKIPESAIIPVGGNPSSGFLARKKYKEVSATATNAQYFDITLNIPSNRRIVATSLRVDVALSSPDGGTSFTAQFYGGCTLVVTTTGGFSKNTKIDTFHDTVGSATTSTTNLRITCNNNKTFNSGGKITAVVYYEEITSMNNVP